MSAAVCWAQTRVLFQPVESSGAYSPGWAAPTKPTLHSSQQWLFSEAGLGPSVSGIYAGKMVSGQQDVVNFSGSAHLISIPPPHRFLGAIFCLFVFFKSIHQERRFALTYLPEEANILAYFHLNTQKGVPRSLRSALGGDGGAPARLLV